MKKQTISVCCHDPCEVSQEHEKVVAVVMVNFQYSRNCKEKVYKPPILNERFPTEVLIGKVA
ncbi:hypothetical protein NQ315_004649 [Exocentrus adspersus]|uniref:Uncharacterized protein n=1 Tax=Exocentrus adspersus TaxID=1586481 RepID=A0AAV8VPV6_9CUCU|nr:hypothetical protein NQ315_004649 [Exocentrus adspersus]